MENKSSLLYQSYQTNREREIKRMTRRKQEET
jgi:hypothetical protein